MKSPTHTDHDLIRNTISSIAIAFDTNTFSALRASFTEDCEADYVGSLGLLTGIDQIINQLQKTIGHVSTFHSLTTQYIWLTGKDTAQATTYCAASHWLDKKAFFAEARYEDRLVRVVDGEEGEGRWMIRNRVVTMMGVPRGDVSMFGMDLEEWRDSLKA
ncbi:nuclear transport factor 2 family protein [Aspergillus stella-maris]|uniref:nuclear transport factor 2 family protein n=1 Tax=Aspergillus stella-maris TaxID=1810926 RepID=UPI003CCC9377